VGRHEHRAPVRHAAGLSRGPRSRRASDETRAVRLAKRVSVTATARNWNTVLKLLALTADADG
jgi:uncharacterized protein (DUF1697 family)